MQPVYEIYHFSIPDEIRTHTVWILSPMPLPIGLQGHNGITSIVFFFFASSFYDCDLYNDL